ncbi:MAG: molybdate ABC transporter substrate-binding protein [Pseudomonadota bacterium]
MRRLLALAIVVAGALAAPLARAEPVVFAAASTARALDAVIAASGLGATVAYGPSGTLARQIEAGARADLFLSANPDWMDHLIETGLVRAADTRALLSNRLVLIAPAGEPTTPITADALAEALADERFAMADPATAPVGRYGQAALEAMGLWDVVAARHVPTRNTIVTVAMVGRGEAVLGLAYDSDALGMDTVEVVHDVAPDLHPPIRYPVARLAGGSDPVGTDRLLAFLVSDEARAVFEQHGFSVVDAVP